MLGKFWFTGQRGEKPLAWKGNRVEDWDRGFKRGFIIRLQLRLKHIRKCRQIGKDRTYVKRRLSQGRECISEMLSIEQTGIKVSAQRVSLEVMGADEEGWIKEEAYFEEP